MLPIHAVREIYCLKIVVSFNFALSAPHVKWRVKSCKPRPAQPPTCLNSSNLTFEVWLINFQWWTRIWLINTTWMTIPGLLSCSCCSYVTLNLSALPMYCLVQSTTSKSLSGSYSTHVILKGGWAGLADFVSLVKMNTKQSSLSNIPATFKLDNSCAWFAVVNAANIVRFMSHCILAMKVAYWMPLSWIAELEDADPISHHQPVGDELKLLTCRHSAWSIPVPCDAFPLGNSLLLLQRTEMDLFAFQDISQHIFHRGYCKRT